MVGNPFTPTFGSEPLIFAGRARIIDDILEGLENGPGDPNRSTILIGPRGSGKTVLLVKIAEKAGEIGWIHARVTADPGMLESIIEQTRINGEAFLEPPLRHRLTGVEISGFGLTREMLPSEQLTWRTRMAKILDELDEQGISLLIEVDELRADLDEMIQLVTAYQHFVSEKRNVALLMAGLPGKVVGLLQHDSVSFLRRAFQRQLDAVSQSEVEVSLRKTVEASGRTIGKQALSDAAKSTGGFPFLIQLIGYHIWRQLPERKRISEQDVSDGIRIAKDDMNRMILETTIRDLSARDVDFLIAMTQDEGVSRIREVATRMNASPALANKYRNRMLRQGLIAEVGQGSIRFELPLLREYLIEHYRSEGK
jgi:hypothetical protein